MPSRVCRNGQGSGMRAGRGGGGLLVRDVRIVPEDKECDFEAAMILEGVS